MSRTFRLVINSLAVGTLAGSSSASEELYVSLPNLGEVRKFDVATGTMQPWASDVGVPFYGAWGTDDHLYIQDFAGGRVLKIAPDGSKQVVSEGGLIRGPLSVAIHPVTAELYVTDAFYQHLVIVDPTTGEQRIFVDNIGGLFLVPGGLSFDMDGNLWMTDHGTNDIVKIDPQGNAVEFLDGPSNGIYVPAGIEVDRSGNIFVGSYGSNYLLRIRMDTAEFEIFCDDPILAQPNDVVFGLDGAIYTTTAYTSALVKVNAMGQATILHHDDALGEYLGVAVRKTGQFTGTMQAFGEGTQGTGGITPRISGYFNPCPGGELGYLIDRGLGGAQGAYLFSLSAGNYPTWGGHLYIGLTSWWGFFAFQFSAGGPGEGKVRFRFTHPDDPNMVGIGFFVQGLSFDPAHPNGIALSNGLEIRFGER